MISCVAEVRYQWRGEFTNDEVNRLHAEAFEHRLLDDDWQAVTERHSVGWVTARDGDDLIGFVNVVGDGTVHAWIQDEMVALRARRQGIGIGLLDVAKDEARTAGCEWLHVDFDDHLQGFYVDAAGFTPTSAGLIDLTSD